VGPIRSWKEDLRIERVLEMRTYASSDANEPCVTKAAEGAKAQR
jgi:hypothetical protein